MIRQLLTIQCDVYHVLSVTNITHLHIWEGVTYNKWEVVGLIEGTRLTERNCLFCFLY